MIFLDQATPPNEIARSLWRELGSEACIAIALMIAVRESESRLLVLDVSALTEVKDEA